MHQFFKMSPSKKIKHNFTPFKLGSKISIPHANSMSFSGSKTRWRPFDGCNVEKPVIYSGHNSTGCQGKNCESEKARTPFPLLWPAPTTKVCYYGGHFMGTSGPFSRGGTKKDAKHKYTLSGPRPRRTLSLSKHTHADGFAFFSWWGKKSREIVIFSARETLFYFTKPVSNQFKSLFFPFFPALILRWILPHLNGKKITPFSARQQRQCANR